MSAPVAITLGGRDFAIRPLTIKQCIEILPAFGRIGGASAESWSAMVDIIHAALRRERPELTRDQLLDYEATVPEMRAAVETIARLTGLERSGEAKAGSV